MWKLIRYGIVLWKPLSGIFTPRSIHGGNNQFFELAGYGRQIVMETKKSPYDPLGSLSQLISDSPTLEANSIDYMREAINCFLGRYLRTATVMIELASENEILSLIEKYADMLNAGDKTVFTKRITSSRDIKQKFDIFYDRLLQERDSFPSPTRGF